MTFLDGHQWRARRICDALPIKEMTMRTLSILAAMAMLSTAALARPDAWQGGKANAKRRDGRHAGGV
jgi:hypothetical protein